MDALFIAVGLAMIVVPAIDIVREIFQPRGRGVLSRTVSRWWWRVLRPFVRRSSGVAALARPMIMLSIVLTWLACSVLGWALLVTPAMGDDAAFVSAHATDFIDAVYLSLVTISTLGYGDIYPSADWLRIIVPIEALFGLGVAAGTIGWLMNVQPVLSHRSALAGKVALLARAQLTTPQPIEDLPGAHPILVDLTAHLASVQSDLTHFPASYYFFAGEGRRSLPDQVAALRDMASRCEHSQSELTRLHAAMLHIQLDDLLAAVARDFLRIPVDSPPDLILNAWHRDHAQARPRSRAANS